MDLYIPEEILAVITSHLELPSAHVIAFDRIQTDKHAPEIDPDENLVLRLGTLASLSCVSRAAHRIAEPYPYKVWPGNRIKDPRGFIAALAARPERATLVKALVIDDHQRWLGPMPTYEVTEQVVGHGDDQMSVIKDRDGNVTFLEAATAVAQVEGWKRAEAEMRVLDAPFDTPLSDLYQSSMSYFQKVVAESPLLAELASDLNCALEEGHPDAVLSVLLIMCHRNIAGFSLTPCCQYGYSLAWRTLANQADPTMPGWSISRTPSIGDNFDSLQCLSLWMSGSARVVDGIGLLAPLIYTQSVVSICIDNAIFETKGNEFDLSWMTRDLTLSPHLRTLKLSNCDVRDHDLPFLPACGNLEALEIVYDSKCDMLDRPWNGRLVADTISKYLPKLEHLKFDVRLCKASEWDGDLLDGMGAPFTSLSKLFHLKTITASPAAFFASSHISAPDVDGEPALTARLPRSIEQITFLWRSRSREMFSADAIEQIHALLSANEFQRLQRISFEWQSAMRPDFLSDQSWQQCLEHWHGDVATYSITRQVQRGMD
ncbi:putative leucine-rich repeat domain superfamily [Septoria linicola]|nr:putative leucine-rich repeat domain superfamily [Septoria linicola]